VNNAKYKIIYGIVTVRQGRRHGFEFEGANIFGAKRRKNVFACPLKILLAPSNFIHVSPQICSIKCVKDQIIFKIFYLGTLGNKFSKYIKTCLKMNYTYVQSAA
jgi:hypothetical protein